MAEDGAKVDQYVEPDKTFKGAGEPAMHALHDMLYKSAADHPGDVHYVFLCRVAMGYTLRTRREKTHGGPGTFGTALDDGATETGGVFATKRNKELMPLPGIVPPIQHHSLLVETCENGPVGSGRPICNGFASGCTTGRVHRYREIVVFHAEQIYP